MERIIGTAPMGDGSYDFLNTRVRSMSRALLEGDFFREVITASGVDAVVEVLLDSPYGPELEAALASGAGIEAAESAIRRNLHATLAKVARSASGAPRRLIEAQLARWEVANVLALLRGKLAGMRAEEIVRGLLPVAQFGEAQLRELASESDPSALADALTTWNYAFAYVARRVTRGVRNAEEMAATEIRMYREYFAWAMSDLGEDDENAQIYGGIMEAQIDLQNVLAALRCVADRERGREPVALAALPGGRLGFEIMERVRTSRTLDDAFEALGESYFGEGIERGILAFGRSRRLSAMERFLEMVVISRGARLFRGDPLGIGVALGFIWRKVNEFLNLRILLRGKAYGVPANAIREELLIL